MKSLEANSSATPRADADPQPRGRQRLLRLPRRTVRLRLTLLYGGVFLLSGVVLLAITYLLVGQTTSVPTRGARGPLAYFPVTGANGRTAVKTGSGGPHVAVTAPKGAAANERVPAAQAAPRGAPLTVDQAQALGRKVEALARQQHNEELHRLLVDLGIALALMASVSMLVGWFLAGRALRPLQAITGAARAISATSLHRRLALRGPHDELRELGETFDELLERLERSFEAQRQFVANASHELRTPLTLERAIVEVTLADPAASNETLRATCERVLAIGEQQERMVEALLVLARSERGLDRRDPFDLAELARDVMVARSPEIASRGLRLESELEHAPTTGDPDWAERLVANLLDNAMQHNAAGGWVSVTSGIEHGRAVLTVSNNGPVIPQEEVERLFRPFQRLGAMRTNRGEGHGLGLSIVSAIATAHGARLRAQARPRGGLKIQVSFDPAPLPRDRTARASESVNAHG